MVLFGIRLFRVGFSLPFPLAGYLFIYFDRPPRPLFMVIVLIAVVAAARGRGSALAAAPPHRAASRRAPAQRTPGSRGRARGFLPLASPAPPPRVRWIPGSAAAVCPAVSDDSSGGGCPIPLLLFFPAP